MEGILKQKLNESDVEYNRLIIHRAVNLKEKSGKVVSHCERVESSNINGRPL